MTLTSKNIVGQLQDAGSYCRHRGRRRRCSRRCCSCVSAHGVAMPRMAARPISTPLPLMIIDAIGFGHRTGAVAALVGGDTIALALGPRDRRHLHGDRRSLPASVGCRAICCRRGWSASPPTGGRYRQQRRSKTSAPAAVLSRRRIAYRGLIAGAAPGCDHGRRPHGGYRSGRDADWSSHPLLPELKIPCSRRSQPGFPTRSLRTEDPLGERVLR